MSLTNWPVIRSLKHVNAKVKTKRDRSHPKIVEFYLHFQKELERRGYPFYAFEFYRSNERQALLRDAKVSNAGPGQSPHNYGCAVDIVHTTLYWDITRKQWEMIGTIGKEVARKRNIPITWGGDFTRLWDPAHWELKDWRKLRQAKELLISENAGTEWEFPADDVQYFGLLERRAKDIPSF